MHLGNIWVSDHFGKCAFFFWNVFRSKNLKSRKKISNVFLSWRTLRSTPKVPSGARTKKIDVRREYYLGRGGWSKLQCVLVCVWRFYFGGARIGSKQPHSKEYPSSQRKIILELKQINTHNTVVYSKRYRVYQTSTTPKP